MDDITSSVQPATFFSDGSENRDTGAWPVRANCLCSQSRLGMDISAAGEYVCMCVSAQVA